MSISMILLTLTMAILYSPALSFLPFNPLKCLPRPLDESFCLKPPSVMDLNPNAYATGIWYKIATSSDNDYDEHNKEPEHCSTVRFSLKEDGRKIETLKCYFHAGAKRSKCIMGMGEWMMEGRMRQIKFESQAGLSVPPYNIVALLGNGNYGYFGAAVYACEKKDGRFVEKLSFYARSPFQGNLTVYLLRRMLQCKGFRFKRNIRFVGHDWRCKYFYNTEGFDVEGMDEMYKKMLMSNLVEAMVSPEAAPVNVRTEMTASGSTF